MRCRTDSCDTMSSSLHLRPVRCGIRIKVHPEAEGSLSPPRSLRLNTPRLERRRPQVQAVLIKKSPARVCQKRSPKGFPSPPRLVMWRDLERTSPICRDGRSMRLRSPLFGRPIAGERHRVVDRESSPDFSSSCSKAGTEAGGRIFLFRRSGACRHGVPGCREAQARPAVFWGGRELSAIGQGALPGRHDRKK